MLRTQAFLVSHLDWRVYANHRAFFMLRTQARHWPRPLMSGELVR
jgi:hypothetical protein